MGRFRYHGDKSAGPNYRKYGWDMIALNRQTMRNLGIDRATESKRLDNGVVIKVASELHQDIVDIHVPEKVPGESKPKKAVHIPGCVARYDFNGNVGNNITIGPYAGTVLDIFYDVVFNAEIEDGAPIVQPYIPESPFHRHLMRFISPATTGAFSEYGMVPKQGSYSIGMTVKIREQLEFPYWDPDYEVYVPVKPWILLNHGGSWIRAAGGTCPLMGYYFYYQAEGMPMPEVDWAGGFVITAPLAEEPKINEHPDFPMPWGLVHGATFNGLFVWGGNRVLAGKQAKWNEDIENQPIVSEPLNIGQYYHVAMSFDAEASLLRFLISTVDDGRVVYRYSEAFCRDVVLEPQSADRITDYAAWKNGEHPSLMGYWGAYIYRPLYGFTYGDGLSYAYPPFQVVQRLDFETVLPRVYHRALAKEELYDLANEVFLGTFVVDDEELPLVQAAGIDVFSYPGEMIE